MAHTSHKYFKSINENKGDEFMARTCAYDIFLK